MSRRFCTTYQTLICTPIKNTRISSNYDLIYNSCNEAWYFKQAGASLHSIQRSHLMRSDRKTGSSWLTILSILWAVMSPVCLALGLFFVAFYDSPLESQAGLGLLDQVLIWSVLSFPIFCVIASLGIWFLKKRNKRAATFAALLPIIPLIPIFAIFGWTNPGTTENLGNALQVSECVSIVFDGGDGLDTTGCGALQAGVTGSGSLSITTEAHNWTFKAQSGQVRIMLKNDGDSCPHVTVLDSQGGIADGFKDENSLRFCPSGMTTTGFFEFRPPSAGTYIIRVFSPETPGKYWISTE